MILDSGLLFGPPCMCRYIECTAGVVTEVSKCRGISWLFCSLSRLLYNVDTRFILVNLNKSSRAVLLPVLLLGLQITAESRSRKCHSDTQQHICVS